MMASMPRLFVAAWPDAATCSTLATLPHPDEDGVRRVPPENWHVTLRFLGATEFDEARERLAGATLPSAVALLGPTIGWLGRHLVAPARGVDELAAAVTTATADLGEPPREFRGHLTLARARRGARSSLDGHPVTARFAVREIALVQSELSPDGPEYRIVATFPTS